MVSIEPRMVTSLRGNCEEELDQGHPSTREQTRDITMPLVQERRQGGHLDHLAAAGIPKTGTTTQRSFGSHRTGHMDPIRRLEPVEEAG